MGRVDPARKREYNRAYYRQNRERMIEAGRAWAAANPERHRFTQKRSRLMRKYGLSFEEYTALLARQEDRCAICRTDVTEPFPSFVVDHDHATGRVRGLLCNQCNLGLGHFDDDVARIRSALHYLEAADG